MQATKVNKDRMQMAVSKIEKPKGVLNLANGVTMAFQILNSGNHSSFTPFVEKHLYENSITSALIITRAVTFVAVVVLFL